jgi:hypothetical protein
MANTAFTHFARFGVHRAIIQFAIPNFQKTVSWTQS